MSSFDYVKNAGKEVFLQLKVFLKWVVFALTMGVIAGSIGTLFHHFLEYSTKNFALNPWLIFFLPFGGIIIVWIYDITKMSKHRGTNFVLTAVRLNQKLSLKTTPLIFISTVISTLFGGSTGREGAALQIGGSIGSKLGRVFKLNDKDVRVLTMCGMSAAFTAMFGTPITATIFSLEITSVGVIYYSALVPCLLSSCVAYLLSNALGSHPTSFIIKEIPEVDAITLIKVIALAALCAIVSILFCITIKKTSKLYSMIFKSRYKRIVTGGIIIIILTLLVKTNLYNCAGMAIIEQSINSKVGFEVFLLKIIFTALTLGAGFKGGEIVPSFAVGASFGNVAAGFLGLYPGFGSAIGLVCVFCGVTNCTISSMMLSLELFGIEGFMYFAIACAISYTFSGYYSLYEEQKIMYSKTEPIFINKNTI